MVMARPDETRTDTVRMDTAHTVMTRMDKGRTHAMHTVMTRRDATRPIGTRMAGMTTDRAGT